MAYRDKVREWDEIEGFSQESQTVEVQAALSTIDILLMESKFVQSGTEGDIVPGDWLFDKMGKDVHVAQYVTANPWRSSKHEPSRGQGETLDDYDARCGRAQDHTGYQANLMVLDLDAHGDTKATTDDWWHLIWKAYLSQPSLGDYVPNFIVKTRNGAHLYFIIEPITDPLLFEARRLKLLKKIKKDWEHNTPYEVDDTKDWTRCIRAPRVIRSDKTDSGEWGETDLRESMIWCIHGDKLDTGRKKWWDVKPTPRPSTIPGNHKYTGNDAKLDQYLKVGPQIGDRYNSTRDVAWYVKNQYVPADWSAIHAVLLDRAQELGLDHVEASHALQIIGSRE